MYADFSSLFVKVDPYNASFDKYLLQFTSKSFVKKIFEKLFLLHVCIIKKMIYLMCEKNWFSTDMKTSSTKHENPPPLYAIKWLVPMRL